MFLTRQAKGRCRVGRTIELCRAHLKSQNAPRRRRRRHQRSVRLVTVRGISALEQEKRGAENATLSNMMSATLFP